MKNKISIIGLGKLGLCLAACYANRGFKVIGIDINEDVVNRVNSGKAPWYEPCLDNLLRKHGGSDLEATLDYSRAITETNLSIILTATPSNPDGTFSNRYIEKILTDLSTVLSKNNKPYHLFVISSTVMPGSVQENFIPLIENKSKRILNKGFGIGYDPDFVALGKVIKGFLEPELVVIGQSDPSVGKLIEELHSKLCKNKPIIFKMSLISAEISKICLNAYITMKISFANTIANLCEKIPGTDPDDITQAIGTDRRISPYYFKGGMAFSGTCFPRDVKVFETLLKKYNLFPGLMMNIQDINMFQNQYLSNMVLKECSKQSSVQTTVGILGLSFIPNSPVITESPGIKLLSFLLEKRIPVIIYDPYALSNVRAQFENSVMYAESVEECILGAQVIVMTHPSKKFKEAIESHYFDNAITIIDCWRIINPAKLTENVNYIPLGKYYL